MVGRFQTVDQDMAQAFSIRMRYGKSVCAKRLHVLEALSCGRELCCSTWLPIIDRCLPQYRYQQLSLNPLKLAGQCGKLRCCLNYELDALVAHSSFPQIWSNSKPKRVAVLQKMDVFKEQLWYAYENDGWIGTCFLEVGSWDHRQKQE